MTDLRADFEKFHAANPRVCELFAGFVEAALRAGRKRYSADALLHRIRWHVDIETTGGDGFKINDHYSAFYARLWLSEHPERPEFFATRVRRSETTEPGRYGRGAEEAVPAAR